MKDAGSNLALAKEQTPAQFPGISILVPHWQVRRATQVLPVRAYLQSITDGPDSDFTDGPDSDFQ